MRPSASASSKLERAYHHLKTLYALIHAFHKSNPYRFPRKEDPQPSEHVHEHVYRIEVVRKLPAVDFALILGDALSNMRSALDHLAYALAVQWSGEPLPEGGTAFPICPKRSQYFRLDRNGYFAPNSGAAKTRFMSDLHQFMIYEFQPCHGWTGGGPHPLALLNALANEDKHKLVQLVDSTMFGSRFEPKVLEDIVIEDITVNYGPVKDDAEVARVRLRQTGPHPKIDLQPEFGFPVELVESSIAAGLQFGYVLGVFNHVFREVFGGPHEPFSPDGPVGLSPI